MESRDRLLHMPLARRLLVYIHRCASCKAAAALNACRQQGQPSNKYRALNEPPETSPIVVVDQPHLGCTDMGTAAAVQVTPQQHHHSSPTGVINAGGNQQVGVITMSGGCMPEYGNGLAGQAMHHTHLCKPAAG